MANQTLRRPPFGFTLIELMVVMAVLALLATLAAPRYFQQTDRAKEAVLRANLQETRRAIDHYLADTGRYPDSLEGLVQQRYLQRLPIDPVTERTDSWILLPPADPELGGVFDLHSGAHGVSTHGDSYADW